MRRVMLVAAVLIAVPTIASLLWPGTFPQFRDAWVTNPVGSAAVIIGIAWVIVRISKKKVTKKKE